MLHFCGQPGDKKNLTVSDEATPIKSNRSLDVLSNALALAEEWGWLSGGGNPSLGVKALSEAQREGVMGVAN